MFRSYLRCPLAVVLLVVVCTPAFCLTNLLQNPSLEINADGDGLADGWQGQIHTDQGATGGFAVDATEKHSGAACQRLDHTSDNTGWVRVSQEPIPARPDAVYRVSVWVSSQCPYTVTLYQFRKDKAPYLNVTIGTGKKTNGWVEVSQVVTAPADAESFKLSLITGGKGSAWFDDAEIVMIAEKPYLKAPRVSTAPVIDGRLDDACWQTAPEIGSFMVLGGNGAAAPVGTRARVVFDSQALIVGFTCEEPNLAGLVASPAGESPATWGDDCVEVFLDPAGDGSGYVHLGLGAGGARGQDRVLGRAWYTDWYSLGGGAAAAPKWQGATAKGDKVWTGEMRLPFSELGATPAVGKVWTLQVCRTRRAGGQEENSTWSYVDGDRYARPERFGSLIFSAGPATAPELVRRKVVAESYTPLIVPKPLSAQWEAGVLRLGRSAAIRIAEASQQPEAELLRDDLQRRFGLKLQIRTGVAAPTDLDLAADIDMAVNSAAFGGAEAYRLRVTRQGLRLAAQTPRGRLYGVETIRQMLAADEKGPFLRCALIRDEPALKWRGWHMSSPKAADIPAYRQLVETLALLKYNTIVWEVDGNLKYEKHPNIGPATAPTKAQLAELVAFAKSRHFEVIPQLALFSHFGFILNNPAYQHLAESQQSTKGHQNRFNYCPKHPEIYPLVFDMMEELTEVFQPKYFHLGRDEASFDDIGVCDRCKGTDPWVLWADDTNKLDAWVKQHGMRSVIWGDQFLPQHNGDKPYFTARATDMVSKDILIFDWHYSPNHKYDETIGYFKQHGFEVVGCPWYEPLNVYDFASAAKRNGILGYCGTTWSGPVKAPRPHLPAAFVIGGENAWATDRTPLSAFPYAPVAEFNHLWAMSDPAARTEPAARREPQGFRLLDLSGHCNVRLTDSERRDGWMGMGPQQDLRSLPTGVLWVGGVPFRILGPDQNGGRGCVMLADETSPKGLYPETAFEIPVGLKTPTLYFLQTCSVPPVRARDLYATTNPKLLGTVTVNYADGSQERVPLNYLADIEDWNGQRGPARAVGVWQGKTANGTLISLGAVPWQNPHPETAIRSVDYGSALATARPVLIGLTAAE